MAEKVFNKEAFFRKEYELLRFFTLVKGKFSEQARDKLDQITNEALFDEEYLNFAVSVSEDVFGTKQLNGVVSTSFVLMNLEKVSPEISDKLLENLFYEYQDEFKKVPLALTGKRVLKASYLEYLLANTDYKLKKKYSSIITKYVLKSTEKKFNISLLTLYFSRDDVATKWKKLVIDSLSESLLIELMASWADNLIGALLGDIKIDKGYENLEVIKEQVEEKNVALSEVVMLIEKKLHS